MILGKLTGIFERHLIILRFADDLRRRQGYPPRPLLHRSPLDTNQPCSVLGATPTSLAILAKLTFFAK